MKRPTIADIAREAGVSKGAVSYALNDRPGVSESTRARILAIADNLGFRANAAARALAGAPAKVVGLALQRPASTLGVEPFFMELISGLEAELSTRSYALLLQMVPDDNTAAEIDVYRQWWTEGRVDGVLLCDVRADDPRVPAVEEIGLPAVIVGPPVAGGGTASLWSDDAVSVTEAVEHLAGLGHRRIARVAGLAGLAHTAARTQAFAEACERLGVTSFTTSWTDYTGEAGARATRDLLRSSPRPTAIVYDNDIMAIAALAVAQEAGFAVPAELSIVAWDDSPVCGLVHPPLTALTRDIVAYGSHAARLLLAVIGGEQVGSRLDEPAHLVVRGSTAPPPLS
ncbi:LacI family DNA-binding transcriptional regulator [Actinoplanes friuliensis]|uniref:LacI family transcriptional regulator n=1 Tax=Actinoplanes friuliensis DSM 7358 TaxID=1246995 RepID=U5W7U2_9ACTN|nr:LacI family DNA-binding transcriptional regulator [Actinoplanes friuliensis]AGZ45204.1 LacI family transcriptional regulator [Actinoplanes friuliensis DSM 7358]